MRDRAWAMAWVCVCVWRKRREEETDELRDGDGRTAIRV